MVNFGPGHARGILHRVAPAERFHHARHAAHALICVVFPRQFPG